MKRWSWRATGAAFLLAGLVAAALGIVEALLSGRANVGVRAGVSDLLYGIGVHLLIALLVTLLLRLLFWRLSDRSFPLLALGGTLLAEFGVWGAYWAGTVESVPHFHTPAGKLATAGLVAAGALVALLLTWLTARIFPRDRWLGPARGALGAAGLLAGGALLLAAAITLWSARPPADRYRLRPDIPDDRPNVYLLLVDTLRRDHLSFFGAERPTSPKLDRLFAESWVFTSAYTPSTWTIPSVASLFTGFYPSAHGVTSALHGIPDAAPTLAEHFRSYGYRSAAFVGNPILTGRNGFAQGFGHYFPPDPPWWGHHNRTALERIATQLRRPGTQGLAWKLASEALDWIAAHRDEPHFVYVHFMEPHSPYEPPTSHRQVVAAGAPAGPREPPRLHDYLDRIEEADCHDWECLSEPPQLAPDEKTGMVANYDGEIHALDEGIELLLAGLRQMELLDDAHLVFCTDHGEEFFDHRGWYHGNSIYEEMIACPLAYRPPGGAPGGQEISRPISLLDAIATLCRRIGLDTPPMHQGRVIPELLGSAPAASDWPVLSEWPRHLFALRLRRWKLIRRGPLAQPDWRLYDLRADPLEQIDLAATHPDTLALLRGYLEGLLAECAQSSLGEATTTTDPELLERLRALGYLQ